MTHQTFFIDIDEEITSIAERLRKAESKEIILVVPKRALLIQSIVNLKLLQKEATNMKQKLRIVTQDKLGKILIEKVGIEVQQKLDEEDEEMIIAESGEEKRTSKKPLMDKSEIDTQEELPKKARGRRIDKIGSKEFFEENAGSSFEEAEIVNDWDSALVQGNPQEISEPEEKIINKELVVDIATEMKKKRGASMDVVSVKAKKNMVPVQIPEAVPEEDLPREIPQFQKPAEQPELKREYSYPRTNNYSVQPAVEHIEKEKSSDFPDKDEKLENFFYNPGNSKGMADTVSKKKTGGGKAFKFIFYLFLAAAIGGVLYSAYLFVPKATIVIATKNEKKSVDAEVTGDAKISEIDYEKQAIPVRLIEISSEISKSFSSTGSKSVSNKKAKGTITIYNEFSTTPQSLVATTRFLSADGKLFRLVKQVSIPGMANDNGTVKPGTVEAEIIADEPGDGYNIGATTFSIPGFKDSGNEKYTKFYAKSAANMSGGGNGNEEMKSISDQDIANAKNKISSDIQNSVKEKIKASAGEGSVVLDDAINVDEPTYKLSNSSGEVVSNFEIKASATAQALVFAEADLKKLANAIIAKSGNGKVNMDAKDVALDYGKATANFTLDTLDIRMHAASNFRHNIDTENLKRGLLGKNNTELEAYLRTYSEIEKVEVSYWPQFITRHIPIYESRVEVILDK